MRKDLKNTALTNKQQKLVEQNIRLAYKAVRRYGKRKAIRGNSDEVLSAAFDGLMRAAITYDKSKSAFSTHAMWHMFGCISRIQTSLIHVPAYQASGKSHGKPAKYQMKAQQARQVGTLTRACRKAVHDDLTAPLIESEQMEQLGHAIKRLDENYATVVRLTLDGLSQRQIADRINIGSRTVSSRLQAAVRQLRTYLKVQ